MDSLEIESLFSQTNEIDEASYERVEYVALTDTNGSNYASGQISFITDNCMKNHICYSESYLQIPIQVAMSACGRIAVKNSLLSLIQGIQIESGSGTSIANENTSTPILANLKLLIDSSTDFLDGSELNFFGKDQLIEANVSGADFSTVGAVSASATSSTGAALGVVPYRNPAMSSRISVFTQRANSYVDASGNSVNAGVAGFQSFCAYIPLKFIHSFFAAMDFPMVNLSLKITVNIAGTSGYTSYCPWTIPTFPAISTLGPASAAAAIADVAHTLAPAVASATITSAAVVATMNDKRGMVQTPKLFLKTVYFRAKEAEMLKKKIQQGFTKELVYTVSQYYPSSQVSGSVNQPIAQGLIRPVRMWVMPLASGTLASSANSFPSSIGPNYLTNCNIQLNGLPIYLNDFKSQYQFYKEFRTQCIAATSSQACGTPISFSDWLGGLNPYVFDLSRNPTVKSNNMCSLTLVTDVKVSATTALAGTFDLVVIIERLQTITLKVSEGGVEITTKQGASARS